MRNAKLTILAALSLAMLAVLAWGYVGMLGVDIMDDAVTPSGKTERGAGVSVWGGQFTVGWQYVTDPKYTALPPGIHIIPLHQLKGPSAPDWFWCFHLTRSGGAGYTSTNWVCPLWFAALPFTIAPIAWLPRRRRREMRGFAVEGSQPSEAATKTANAGSRDFE